MAYIGICNMTALHHYWLRPANQLVPQISYRASYGGHVGPYAIGKEAAIQALFDIMPHVHDWSDCYGTVQYALLNPEVDVQTFRFSTTYTPCTNSIGISGGGLYREYTGTVLRAP